LGDLEADGRTILKWILNKQGPVPGSCENDNEPSDSIIGGKSD